MPRELRSQQITNACNAFLRKRGLRANISPRVSSRKEPESENEA
jgi:hypothetical protein